MGKKYEITQVLLIDFERKLLALKCQEKEKKKEKDKIGQREAGKSKKV